MTGPGCHPDLPAELRALVSAALDRIAPMIERVRAEPATGPGQSCAACPVCAVIAVLRGERPELAVRLAEQAVGLLVVLRAALDEGGPAPTPQPGASPPVPSRPGQATPAGRVVQHIPVERFGMGRDRVHR